MRRCSGAVVLLFSAFSMVLAMAGPTVPAASASTMKPLPAIQADTVVDAYGIGIHLPFLDTPYADATKVADALSDLGVRHVRDDLFLDNTRQYDGIRTVAAKGIAFNLIMGRPDKPGTPADYVRTVAQLPAGAVESVEGVNEWDHFGANRSDWAAEATAWQQDLYTETKANPATAHLPVLSPSMAFKWNYQFLPDLSAYSDRANAHMYPGGHKPTNEVTQITSALRTIVPGKPLVVTEAGYHNAVNTTHGHLPVSEEAAGLYLPRLLLDHVARGHERVYSYELIDEFADTAKTDPEANFGLLRRDWSPKPAYTAMKTLLGLLSDPGPDHATTPLPVATTGWPADGRHLVTQKRDGSYVVLVWRDAQVYDPVTRQALPNPTAEVTMTFGEDFDTAVYRVSEGPQPVIRSRGSSLRVPMDGGVTALTLTTPTVTTPAPAPEPEVTATVPGAPTISWTRARRHAVTVVWKAPAANGRRIRGYRLRYGANVRHVGASRLKATLRGLPRRTRLRVAVRARNAMGWGAPAYTGRLRTR